MKKYLFTITPFTLGILCFVLFGILGSEVATDGTLIEPFAFIPLGYLLIAVSLIIGLLQSTWALVHNPEIVDKCFFGISLLFVVLSCSYICIAFYYLN